jgi:hypothetical protein
MIVPKYLPRSAKKLNSGDPHTQFAVFLSTLTGNILIYKMES